MDVVETKNEGLVRDHKIKVAAEDIGKRVDERLTEVGKTVRIPGFRGQGAVEGSQAALWRLRDG